MALNEDWSVFAARIKAELDRDSPPTTPVKSPTASAAAAAATSSDQLLQRVVTGSPQRMGDDAAGTAEKSKTKTTTMVMTPSNPVAREESPEKVLFKARIIMNNDKNEHVTTMAVSVTDTCSDVLDRLCTKYSLQSQHYNVRLDDEVTLVPPETKASHFGASMLAVCPKNHVRKGQRVLSLTPAMSKLWKSSPEMDIYTHHSDKKPPELSPTSKSLDELGEMMRKSMSSIFNEDVAVSIRPNVIDTGTSSSAAEASDSSATTRNGYPVFRAPAPISTPDSERKKNNRRTFHFPRSMTSVIPGFKDRRSKMDIDVEIPDTPPSPTQTTPQAAKTKSSEDYGNRKRSDSKKRVESVFFSSSDPAVYPEKRSTEAKRKTLLPFFSKQGGINRAKKAKNVFRPEDIVKRGPLMMRGKKKKDWKQRFCLLTSDGIYLFEKEEHVATGEWKYFIRLADIKRISRINEKESRKYCLRIVSTTGETFLSASSDEEIQAWYLQIRPLASAAEEGEEEQVVYLGRYEAGRTIGEGGYAEVRIGQDLTTQRKVAIKVINKDLSDHKGLERLEREISFLCCMEHPNIVKLYDVLDGDTTAVLIMEYIDGQTLDDFVYEAKGHHLPDYVCRYLFKKLLSAVQYIHSLYVVHRDLKMENVMVNSNGELYLLDFGLSNRWHPGLFLETFCGTLEYAAPEVVSKAKSYEGGPCDVWSLGVMLFSMLTGKFPFEEESVPLTLEKMQQGFKAIKMPFTVPQEAISLFQIIFDPDPETRATLQQVEEHPWMQDANDEGHNKSLAYFASLE